MYGYARSFTSADLNIQSPMSVAGFIYAFGKVERLKIRATTRVQERVDYAPVIFFAVEGMQHSELQFTAPRPHESFVLGVNLLTEITLFECHLFSSFDKSESYPTALRLNGHFPAVERCTVDLCRSDTEAWFAVLK